MSLNRDGKDEARGTDAGHKRGERSTCEGAR